MGSWFVFGRFGLSLQGQLFFLLAKKSGIFTRGSLLDMLHGRYWYVWWSRSLLVILSRSLQNLIPA